VAQALPSGPGATQAPPRHRAPAWQSPGLAHEARHAPDAPHRKVPHPGSAFPSATGPHRPGLAPVQPWQSPVQAPSQQTPSAQKPDAHSVPALQACPSVLTPSTWTQAPASRAWPAGQLTPASPVPPSSTLAGTQTPFSSTWPAGQPAPASGQPLPVQGKTSHLPARHRSAAPQRTPTQARSMHCSDSHTSPSAQAALAQSRAKQLPPTHAPPLPHDSPTQRASTQRPEAHTSSIVQASPGQVRA
jgi:hypothetical protein